MSEVGEKILSCVYAAVDEANEDRVDLPPLKKSPDTPIQGVGTDLDSLALINFLVATEEKVEQEFQVVVPLSDDRALIQEPSPFKTISTVVAYVEELLREHRGDH